MIIDKISLENFGAYRGSHQVTLCPACDRPVTLIGGMNGGGKTTFLDAIQLALYGQRARTSNRGHAAYKKYLLACMNNMSKPEEATCLQLHFRLTTDGTPIKYQLTRSWYRKNGSVEETLEIRKDGSFDHDLTENWQDFIEGYLPVKIAHLFFFDGEQIKKLAEGDATAEILGTAIQSLLGLDIVDQLQNDLRVFMRKKREEGLSLAERQRLETLQEQLEELDRHIESTCLDLGHLRNEAGQALKHLERTREQFRQQGGEIWNAREEIEAKLAGLKADKLNLENRLRELAAGPLPLSILATQLSDLVRQIQDDTACTRAQLLLGEVTSRDERILATVQQNGIPKDMLQQIKAAMEAELQAMQSAASREVLLDTEEGLAVEIEHLQHAVLPPIVSDAQKLVQMIRNVDIQIDQQTTMIERIPAGESLQTIITELDTAEQTYQAARDSIAAKEANLNTLRGQQKLLEGQIDKLGHATVEAKYEEEDRQRMLKHSERVNETMKLFRTAVAKRHIERLSGLILECFQSLLRKQDLITALSIDPATFEMTLYGRDGAVHDFQRLSAGEQQLLATAILWGLARASGRPVPTIIDTPLGRLDSSHRINLVQRYFPVASHQVVLLSTDEEIVGRYFSSLKPKISNMYLLEHDEATGSTTTKEGYFDTNETHN